MPDEVERLTIWEFQEWLNGYFSRNDIHIPKLLRLIAYQSITLNPYIDQNSKPYDIYDYYLLYNERNERLERLKNLEYINPVELLQKWEKKSVE